MHNAESVLRRIGMIHTSIVGNVLPSYSPRTDMSIALPPPVSGTLTFAPGQTTATISVPRLRDATFEAPETFTVTLSGATYAAITTANGTATVTDALALGACAVSALRR